MIAHTTLLLTTLMTAAVVPRASVSHLDGARSEGEFVALTTEHLVLKSATGSRELARKDLLSIRFARTEPEATQQLATRLELTDGSLLATDHFQADEKQIVTIHWQDEPVKIAARQIASVRFLEQGPPLDAQWNEIRLLQPTADLLVIRKGESLDYVEGRVLAVTDVVKFELDGDPLDVRLNKVAGIVFLRPDAPAPEAIGIVRDHRGSAIQVSELAWLDDRFALITPAGAKLELPLGRVREIDLAAGKLRFLSDLEPTKTSYQPFLPSSTSAPIIEFFGPRRDLASEGGELLIGGKAFAKGLALRSRSEIEYRLPTGYVRLKATVGIDDRIRHGGSVVLSIHGDGKQLYSELIRGGQPPLAIDLAIEQIDRLVIEVDYGDDSDLGDHLNMGDARITK